MNVLKLDHIFSKYIRLLWADKGGMVKCYTCPGVLRWEDAQCGHFMSRRFMATRFMLNNCRVQCPGCNLNCSDGGEKQAVFEANLRKELGDEVVDGVILAARSVKKWAPWEIKEMEYYYKERVERLMRMKRG